MATESESVPIQSVMYRGSLLSWVRKGDRREELGRYREQGGEEPHVHCRMSEVLLDKVQQDIVAGTTIVYKLEVTARVAILN